MTLVVYKLKFIIRLTPCFAYVKAEYISLLQTIVIVSAYYSPSL